MIFYQLWLWAAQWDFSNSWARVWCSLKEEKSSWISEKLYWLYQNIRVQRTLSTLWVLPSNTQSLLHPPTTQDPMSAPLASPHLPFPWAWLEWQDRLWGAPSSHKPQGVPGPHGALKQGILLMILGVNFSHSNLSVRRWHR